MSGKTCDLCSQPATDFHDFAVSGGPTEVPVKSVSLCAEHQILYAKERRRLSLAHLLKTLHQYSYQAKPIQQVQVTIAARDEQSAQNVQRAMLQLCGGESLIFSPEALAERLHQIAVELHGENAPHIPAAHFQWEVHWNADTKVSVLDKWQTGGWSQRMYDLIADHNCELQGWHIDAKRRQNR